MVKKLKGKKDNVRNSSQPEDVIDYDTLVRELEQKIREINARPPPVTDDEIQAEEQERQKVTREFLEKESQLREAIRKRELDEEIRETMRHLLPLAPDWKDEQAVAKFAKLRPLRLVPVIDLDSPPYPERTERRGAPKGERAFLSVMPDAERAFVEIEWFLTELYPKQTKKAIKDRAYALAAAQFEIEPETLRKYCKRSSGERQRLWPRPKISLPQ